MSSSAVSTPLHNPTAVALSRRRRATSRFVEGLCVTATLIGLVLLASILITLIKNGIGGMSLSVFTQTTPQNEGDPLGLLDAIAGSLEQAAIGTLIGTPIGLLVGTYLSEYGRFSRLGYVVRFVADILLSAPSILIGLFVYLLASFVAPPENRYSGWAGTVALALIVIPIVVRTTEDMLRLVPVALREAAVALGAPKWKSITQVCYRAARDGIVTGILLAIARVTGETAPLLFTSLGNNTLSFDLTQPMSSLPVTIYNLSNSPSKDWVQLGWVGALLITFGVLALNILARVVLRKRS